MTRSTRELCGRPSVRRGGSLDPPEAGGLRPPATSVGALSAVVAQVSPILTEIAAVSAQITPILPQLASIAAGFAQRGTPFGARVGLMGVTHVSAHFATVVADLTPVGAHFTPILTNLAAIVPRVGVGVGRWRRAGQAHHEHQSGHRTSCHVHSPAAAEALVTATCLDGTAAPCVASQKEQAFSPRT